MSPKPVSPIRRAWYRWKALRLPWRRRFLVGLDLNHNTFWEFADKLSSTPGRMRRIVQYRNATLHYSDAAVQISPAWHQWLRHTRHDPPSLAEQSQDVFRQEQLKVLAAQADARWAAKPSYLDAPGTAKGQPLPELGLRDLGVHGRSSIARNGIVEEWEKEEGIRELVGTEREPNKKASAPELQVAEPEITLQPPNGERYQSTRGRRPPRQPKEMKDDPWKRAGSTPGEDWQPQKWDPNSLPARR